MERSQFHMRARWPTPGIDKRTLNHSQALPLIARPRLLLNLAKGPRSSFLMKAFPKDEAITSFPKPIRMYWSLHRSPTNLDADEVGKD